MTYGKWVAGNITGRTLTGQEFSECYEDGEMIVDGAIRLGGAAVVARNRHGSSPPMSYPIKSTYKSGFA